MRNQKKIQNKCVQTHLTSEGELAFYRLMYPISQEFKAHLQVEEPDEHDFIETIAKNGKVFNFYVRSSSFFSEIRKWKYLVMIKQRDFKIKTLQSEKKDLVQTFSNF